MTTTPPEFDEFATDYDAILDAHVADVGGESSIYYLHQKIELLQELAPAHLDVRHVLDYGCGTGRAGPLVAEAFTGASYTGLDPSGQSIERARHDHGTERVRFEQLTGKRIPLEDNTVDLAFAAVVFHHIEPEDHRDSLAELKRVLRPGGLCVIFEHNPYNPLTRKIVRDCPFDEGVTLLRPGYARSLLSDAGLRDVRLSFYLFFPRQLSMLRPLARYLSCVPLGGQYHVSGFK